MKMLKKSVSVLLSLIMVWGVFSAAPFCVGAATVVTTWQQLVSAVSSGGSVILGADITSGPFDSFLHITGGKRVDVDLNGYALSRGESSNSETGTVFKIGSGATLRITDSGAGSTGKISGGSSEQGGAFFNEGTLLIEGGSICQNTSSVSGGAVYNKGTFTMSGGMLSGNISEDGGALFNAAGGTAVLSGTAILKDNECHTYGGGAVTNYGQLTVSDSAEISNNKAFMRGGGIWTGGSATLNLYGGTITENSAGITGNGVYYRDGTLNMKGSPIIRCNDEDDLFLCEGKKINITGKLTRSSPDPVEYPNVAIVTSGADRIVTSGYSQYNPDASDPSFFFFSYDHHYFTLENGEVYSEAFKTSYVYRYWDEAAEKVRTGRGERSDAIDVATLQDNSSVSLRDNWYIVRGNVTIRHRLTIAGTANLILADGAVLTCKDGIRSERKLNSVLNIYPQSEGTGKLVSKTGGQNWAAIGGNTAADAGTFNLHGGTVEARAPRSGIAGGTNPDGNGGAGGPVKIFAGTVNVTATDEAALGAAIGGGDSAPACWDTREGIAIYGGTVAVKSYFGSGIGNGSGEVTRSTGAISIYGGKIDARGDTGIGGGNDNGCPPINISGGDIVAVGRPGRSAGAGIGGGDEGKGGTVNIRGGIVYATSTTYDRTGELYNDVEKFFNGSIKMDPSKAFVNNFTNAAVMLVILSITAIVDFARDNNVVGAGIGGGYDESGGTVNISGDAIVCAQTGLSSAAAIGKGKGGDANGGLRLADDLTVMAGKSLDSLSRVSKNSRESLCRSKCAQIMPCDHQGATFDTRDESHRANCEWCKTGEWAAHRFDSSGHVCPECGYSRVLISFDANGGTKSMEPVYAKQGSDYKLPICRFSPPEGKVFIGWSVNGGEELFPPNTPLAFDGDTTLTANWSDYLGLFVNDVAVSQNNKNDILGDGAVSFDSDSCVLTLNNAAITKISAESIALTVRGSGVIHNPSGTAIFVHTGSLTIDGDFDITASDIGLKTEGTSSAAGKVNIADGNISIAGGSRGISSQSGLYICNEIERLEVTANTSYGSKAINAYNILNGSFVIESELSVKEPENGRIYGPDISGDPTHVIIEPKIVTVSFDANGANDTGAYAMEPVAGKQTNVIDLPDCAFQTPSEKVFAGWSLGGKTYQPGDDYTLSEDVTFTAVWKNELCTLTIHSNTGDDETETYSIPYGEDFIIPDNEFDYPDDMLLIKRWKEDPVSESKLHKFGAIITVTDDMDLYGMYSPNHTHTLMPVEAVAAACETRGNIACRQCQMCGKYYADENASQRIGEDAIYIPATGHTPGEAVREYEYPPSVGTHGSYNSVVYCTVCEQELSRELIFLPMTAIGYVDENGGDHSAADYALLTPETEELTGWVAATTGMTNQNRLTVSGEANLILFDGANVTVPKGIAVNEGANLTIWQQSDGSGTLIAAAEADSYNAAIGGNSGRSSGLITINGGVVDATGSKYGAGIGGGNQHIGTVVINGGSVTAQGGYHAAGIGGGTQGLATVTVNGGVVNATGGDSGAGIGAGYNNAYLPNKALNVTINGGKITATGGSGASAIGCGDRTDYGSCSVSINGGQITANGGVSSKCTDSRQGSIILNWTDDSKASMSLTSDSYSGAVTLSKTFRDENGNIYGATDSADNSALAGKTLTPCEGIFAGYSLSLGGDIGVNFYLDLPDEALAQGVRIDFAWNGKTDSVTFDSNSAAETREGVAGLYKATCNVCAAEMNDAVTACVTVGESAGPVETVSRKVRDYADYILANKDGKYSDKLITLVKSMLNYGANAQTQFEHNTDALANAGVGYPLSSLNDNEINGIAGAVPEKDSIHALLADKGIAYHGYSLILNTKTTLRVYFKKDGADYTQLALLNSAGANVGTVQDQDTDDCYIEVGDISAFELGDCYELKFGDTTLGSFSALSYVKDVLQNNNGAQPITDTVTALYRYHEAAAAYFNHNA